MVKYMTNDVARSTPLPLDSIDAFDDTIIGDDGTSQGGGGFLPDGTVIKFTKTEKWNPRNSFEDITGKVLIHLDTIRSEVEWGQDKKPVKAPRLLPSLCSMHGTRLSRRGGSSSPSSPMAR